MSSIFSLLLIGSCIVLASCSGDQQDNAQVQKTVPHASTATVFHMSAEKKKEFVQQVGEGNAEAAYRLSLAWGMGDQNDGMGLYWLYRSATMGFAAAEYGLSIRFKADPMAGTPEEAVYWERKAVADGYKPNLQSLKVK